MMHMYMFKFGQNLAIGSESEDRVQTRVFHSYMYMTLGDLEKVGQGHQYLLIPFDHPKKYKYLCKFG